MKKVVFPMITILMTFFFISCKEEPKEFKINNESVELAIAEKPLNENLQHYVYVTASSGLSLRKFNNLHSEKIAIIPYGTRLKVITAEDQTTMTVGEIDGGMHEIEFNHQKGFVFNGYLSDFFPPEKNSTIKGYADELKKMFPEANYEESVGGSATHPSNTSILLLPTSHWHEAFFIAQNLFDVPKEFKFPSSKGYDEQIIMDPTSKVNVWSSEIHIVRLKNTLQKITYKNTTEKMSSVVEITREGEHMKIVKTEIIK